LKKVVLITPGQPSSNPRLLKEALTLDKAGYVVTVIYCFWVAWADPHDQELINQNPSIRWIRVGGHPTEKKLWYWYTRLRHKLFRIIAGKLTTSVYWQQRAVVRCYNELKRTAARIKGDLYIAHNTGALAPAALAAQKNNTAYAFDGEDFHRGEVSDKADVAIVTTIEDKYLPGVRYFTAASPLIAAAYNKNYPQKDITVIRNVFSKRFAAPFTNHSDNTVQLFWFSQTVGPARGLEVVIAALNQLKDYQYKLHVLGYCTDAYRATLEALAHQPFLAFIEPVPLKAIFEIAAGFDIGLATEMPYTENRKICLTNKLFIYMQSGNCVVASDTDAQQQFLQQYPGSGLLYKHNDPDDLAIQFRKLFDNKAFLQDCRQKSWNLGHNELNWEKESEIWLSLIRSLWSK